jgi:hypothetical protein
MSDGIRIPVSVDDKDAIQGLNRLKERVSKVGSAVSGMGFALGSASTKMGGLVAEAGNLVGALSAFGLAGGAVAAAAAGVAFLYNKIKSESDAISESNKVREKTEKDSWAAAKKGAEDAEEALRNYGKTSYQIEVAKIKVQREEILESRRAMREEESKLERSMRLIDEAIDRGIGSPGAQIARRNAVLSQLEETRAMIMGNIEAENNTYRKFDALGKLAAVAFADAKRKEDAKQAKADAVAPRDSGFGLGAVLKQEEDRERMASEVNKRLAEQLRKGVDEGKKADKERAQEEFELRLSFAEKFAAEEERLRKQREDSEKAMISDAADFAISAARMSGDFALSELVARDAINIRLAEARKRGDVDAVRELEEERKVADETMWARIAERLSAEAIGTGTMLAMKYGAEFVGSGFTNVGAAAAAGMGVALAAAGAGGTLWSGGVQAKSAAAAETRAYNRSQQDQQDTTPRGSVGAGRAQTGGPTVINYYFGGPVFGNADDAARAVAAMNARGARLEGRP